MYMVGWRRTDEGEVDDLEKPGRDFSAEDGPTIVLVVASQRKVLTWIYDDELAGKRTHSRKSPRRQVLWDSLNIHRTFASVSGQLYVIQVTGAKMRTVRPSMSNARGLKSRAKWLASSGTYGRR